MRVVGRRGQIGGRTRRRLGTALTCTLALTAVIAFCSAGAHAISIETPLVGVELDARETGIDVGVSLPVAGTDVEANVGAGDDGISVRADVGTPAPDSGGTADGAQSNGAGDSSAQQESKSPANSVAGSEPSLASAGRERPDPVAGEIRDATPPPNQKAPRSGARTIVTQEVAPTAGLLGLVASRDEIGSVESGASQGGETSAVAQLVAYIPTWLWMALFVLLAALLVTLAYAMREHRHRRAADRLATRDALTGLMNVMAFEERLGQEWARTRRYGGDLGVLMIDLDCFKAVNDEHGHAAGNQVLTATADELRARTRDSDLVSRIGGDEFAVICPHTDIEGLEALRDQLEAALPLAIGFGVGVSIGVAEFITLDKLPSEMIARADAAMYAQKASHRHGTDADRSLTNAA